MQVQPDIQQKPKKTSIWSIGIFSGPSLAELKPAQGIQMPVLSADDVTDVSAMFLADPFMIHVDNTWHMFFEVMIAEEKKGEIGWATSSDGFHWEYRQIVLSEAFHLSYPHVFRVGAEYFMIPESYEANAMRLYQADPFPFKWSYAGSLLEGPWVDSSVFAFEDRWWAFSNPVAPPNQTLELFYATSVAGPWYRHPMSPIVTANNRMARSAGRVIVTKQRPIRFTQDCFPLYGTRVRAFEITTLTTSSYAEREIEGSPILGPGHYLWNQSGMHHIDPHFRNGEWFACVDGWRFKEETISL